MLPILQTKKLQLLAGAERWLDRSSLQWGRTHGKQVSQTDGTVVLLEFPALSAEALCVCAREAPQASCAALFTRSEAGWVWAGGARPQSLLCAGRFPTSPAGHHPDSQAVKTELSVWGCYLKKIPTFLSDDPSPVSISQWQLGLFHQRRVQWQAHTYWKKIFGALQRDSPLRFSEPQAPCLLNGHNSDSVELWKE